MPIPVDVPVDIPVDATVEVLSLDELQAQAVVIDQAPPTIHRTVDITGISPGFTGVLDTSAASVGEDTPMIGRGFAEVGLDMDLESTVGWTGATTYFGLYGLYGKDGTEVFPTLQGNSNIDAPSFVKPSEIWFDQAIGEVLSLRIGRMDANSEFAYVDNGGEFINPSMGVSPTVFAIPTYPDPQMGARARIGSGPISLKAAVFPQSANTFVIGETEAVWEGAAPGRVAVGGWVHAAPYERPDGSVASAAVGAYLVADQSLGDGPGLFFQAGMADPELAELDAHIGGGLAWTGALSRRSDDSFGVGATWVHVGNIPDATAPHELTAEAFYRAQVTGGLSLKLDMQAVQNPGGIRSEQMGFAGTLRTELAI